MNYKDCDGLWDLAVLSVLQERPMHPYEIRSVLRERNKTEVLALRPGSLYHAISRLERDGFIKVAETIKEGKRPAKTVYDITEAGKAEVAMRLTQRIASPRVEPNDFTAALSFLVYLKPAQAIEQLRLRVAALQKEEARIAGRITAILPRVSRINLVEEEYTLHLMRAEIEWIGGLIHDLESKKLDWDIDAILTYLRTKRK